MRSRLVAAVAMASALVALAGLGAAAAWRTNVWSLPTGQKVRVATAHLNDGGRKFFAALKEEIAARRTPIHLSLLETADPTASAEALKDHKVDAAVIRSDNPAAAEGRTLFVLRNLYVALLVPATAPVSGISKLKGKKIAVLMKGTGLDPMARVVLDFYGIDEKHIARLGLQELPGALQHKQVSAVMVIGSTGAGPILEAIDAFRKVTKRPPNFVDISEAKAMAERFAIYDEAEISVGAFGGSPAVPAETVQTISANLLLVSQPSLSNRVAGDLTQLLLATKAKLATTLPEAGQLSAPSTDNDELLPVHPGTLAFLNGTETSMFDDPTNVILLISMLFGLLGSIAAWVRALRKKTKNQEIKRQMRRLPLLLAECKSANGERLDGVERELDEVSEWLSEKFISDNVSLDDFRNAEARLAHLRAVIQDRRASAPSGGEQGRAEAPELLVQAEPSPSLQLEDTGVLYRLPDRQRDRVVIIDNVADGDARQPERIPLAPPSAAA
jgi:TRAP transporter TAXI family solute receptor